MVDSKDTNFETYQKKKFAMITSILLFMERNLGMLSANNSRF